MFKLQVQDDEHDPNMWRDVTGPDGAPLTFQNETEARAKLEELFPILIKMERYASGPKRTRVLAVIRGDRD